MTENIYTSKNIYLEPYWNTHHQENCMLIASIDDEGIHPIHFAWDEISDIKIDRIASIFECCFKLDLTLFGVKGGKIPILSFVNDHFSSIFYTLDENNKIIDIKPFDIDHKNVPIEGNMEALLKANHYDLETEGSTEECKGKKLKIAKNENAPVLKKLSQEEIDAYAKTEEFEDVVIYGDMDNPMYFFIALDDDENPLPQNDIHDLLEIYLYTDAPDDAHYFGAILQPCQSHYDVPLINGKELPFIGQFNSGAVFNGCDIDHYIFYDAESKTVAIFQQQT